MFLILTWFVDIQVKAILFSSDLFFVSHDIFADLQTGRWRFVRLVSPVEGQGSLEPQVTHGSFGVLQPQELGVKPAAVGEVIFPGYFA